MTILPFKSSLFFTNIQPKTHLFRIVQNKSIHRTNLMDMNCISVALRYARARQINPPVN